MEDMHALFNSNIANPNYTPENLAITIVARTYSQILRGSDPTEKAELELALAVLISLARRVSQQADYIHFIRLVIHQPVKYYQNRLTTEELSKLNCTEYNEYYSILIGLLNKCLSKVDPNQHVTGKEAHLDWLPEDMVKLSGWSLLFSDEKF
jgi:hypothetical protein